ncbi:hypothetical protein BCD67_01915 [Oscillatoriales cyanobacterium USR001]|nr:hypothetical protein BCD67_01915 [Oscillatoriales cyanobacterium USR001]
MTPTLFGRWQTRLFLLATVGIVVTMPFFLGLIGTKSGWLFFWILGYIAIFGLIWDILYIYIQQFRWDRDWPGVFQLLGGIWEAVFLVLLVKIFGLPGISKENFDLGTFALHYSLVWVIIYLASQTLLRILFPYWRFRGGQWF